MYCPHDDARGGCPTTTDTYVHALPSNATSPSLIRLPSSRICSDGAARPVRGRPRVLTAPSSSHFWLTSRGSCSRPLNPESGMLETVNAQSSIVPTSVNARQGPRRRGVERLGTSIDSDNKLTPPFLADCGHAETVCQRRRGLEGESVCHVPAVRRPVDSRGKA
mmetsp:Transcript_13321/g.40391  ORF Transcript_13321/g.40391 Transcript_13321/m.40391 type:complete len:164 (-) Transcript_13321:887-1378(-)|eukprot:scaffold304328_cov32-Tisochrysis_lutea.AAC.3